MSDLSYTPEEARDWNSIHRFFEKCQNSREQWIFRGQNNVQWFLETLLERSVYQYSGVDEHQIKEKDPQVRKQRLKELQRSVLRGGLENPRSGKKPISILTLEGGLLRRFKRQYWHFSDNTPEEKNYIEWFAIMRHHHGPTRLLDWTYSFFVALYFALENAKNECVVWGLNTTKLESKFETVLKKKSDRSTVEAWKKDKDITKSETFNKLFIRPDPISLVAAVNPYRLNERLVIQQGVFLVPGDASKSFEDNLSKIVDSKTSRNFIKLQISLTPASRRDILTRLVRMNVSNATLFPGLDGFTRSLAIIHRPDFFIPDDEWPTDNSC